MDETTLPNERGPHAWSGEIGVSAMPGLGGSVYRDMRVKDDPDATLPPGERRSELEPRIGEGDATPDPRDRGGTAERVRDARPVTEDRLRVRMMRHRVRALVTADATPYRIGGRYVVDEQQGERGRLGKGGMGVVYAVRDVELDRRCVAKFMYRGGDQRFRREAQMLALFSHPNIVQVHDTGYDEEDFFIVMAYVAGDDLRTWAAPTSSRSWREVVKVFVQVARGLGEAHANRVVHRDVTPGNIRISRRDDAWVAQVLDFGIAGQLDPAADDGGGPPHVSGRVGTPGYMSPELCEGAAATARSDQFSLCICLYQALFGVLPFGPLSAGDGYQQDLAAYERRVLAGEALEPKTSSSLRRLFDRVLRRGLQRDPARRFTSMAALQVALEEELVRSERVRRTLTMTGLVAFGVAGVLWGAWQPTIEPAEQCRFEVEADVVWSDTRRRDVEARLPEATRRTILGRLDGVRSAWLRTRTQTCVGALQGVPPAVAAAQRACLERQWAVFDAVVGHGGVFGASLVALELLPSEARVAACTRAEPGVETQLPDAASAEIERLLAQAEAALVTGNYDEGREVAAMALRRAEARPDGPLLARAMYQYARGQTYGIDPAAAAVTLERAALLADRHRLVDLAADIKLRQLRIAANYGSEAVAAVYFTGLLERLERLDERDGPREAEGRQFMADLALRRGDAEAAEREVVIVERLRANGTPWERARARDLRGRLELVYAYASTKKVAKNHASAAQQAFEQALSLQQERLRAVDDARQGDATGQDRDLHRHATEAECGVLEFVGDLMGPGRRGVQVDVGERDEKFVAIAAGEQIVAMDVLAQRVGDAAADDVAVVAVRGVVDLADAK